MLLTAHDSVMSGDTGVARTTTRVLSQFFWLGVTQDFRMCCPASDVCQRTVDKSCIPSASLQQMPVIEEPFKCVALDFAGSFDPMSVQDHRYILTIVDVATRFPEAVSLKHIDKPAVAEALLFVF